MEILTSSYIVSAHTVWGAAAFHEQAWIALVCRDKVIVLSFPNKLLV